MKEYYSDLILHFHKVGGFRRQIKNKWSKSLLVPSMGRAKTYISHDATSSIFLLDSPVTSKLTFCVKPL